MSFKCSQTWSANSRVGARIKALSLRFSSDTDELSDEEDLGRDERICWMIGSPYASVFPDP